MEICFEGIGQTVATFAAGKGLTAGMAVTMTGSGEVGLGSANSPLCGVTVGAERKGAAAVPIGGVAQAGSAEGESINVGWQGLACDGTGKLIRQESGIKYLVLAVDEVEKTVTVRL